jgi:4-amino-4-deoxy-L-arabinose transferase-like glycosyltransferase
MPGLIEREWREASDLRTSRMGLAIVLIAAAVLRFWALDQGIPYAVQIDEPEIVERAFNMMRSGSLNPQGFFDYPGVAIYVQVVVSVFRFLAGAVAGEWSSLAEVTGGDFYLWGRAVTAAFGVATVLLVYHIGMRWGARHALLAAGLLAVLPLHVRYSHYVLTDTLLTFFVALTFLLSLVAHERKTVRAFAVAGAAAGLAAATKYTGGVAVILPLLACWMTVPARASRLTPALAIVASSAAAFLAGAPYTLLDLPGFLNAAARLANEYRVTPAESASIVYLKLLLRHAFQWPALLLAAGGLGLGIVRLIRGPGRVRWALAVVFPVVYFWMIRGQGLIFARYLLPLVPPLCVLAATAVVSGVSLLRRYEIPRAARTALIAALTIAALLPPALMSARWDRDAARTATVDLAYDWILRHVPPQSSVAIESRALLLPATYRSRNISQLREMEYAEWRDQKVDYLIASSEYYNNYFQAPEKFPREYAEYMRIFEQSRELVRFSPSSDTPGPELRILKVIP